MESESRRNILRAESDAYCAKLYGLTRDELGSVLDSRDAYDPDFLGETFRVPKRRKGRITANTAPAAWFWRLGAHCKQTHDIRKVMEAEELKSVLKTSDPINGNMQVLSRKIYDQ